MSYAEQKAKRKSGEANNNTVDHSWEEERLPLLHSGFIEPCTADASRSQIAVQLYFSNGTYRARVQDREDGVQAFVQGTNLETLLDVVEQSLKSDVLDWSPMQGQNGHARGR